MKMNVRTDRKLVRATARSDRYLLIELTAPASPTSSKRPPVNVSFVMDRSGSMGGEKIELARQAIRQAIGMLGERDRFSLVFYDDRIDVVVENTPATREAKRNALDRIADVQARGTTNLAEGWLRGIEQIAEHESEEFVHRCLLVSDGLANVGIIDPAELEGHASEIRRRGVSTSTFGIGADFDEDLLQRMAVAGGGNFYFIQDPRQIPDFLTSELGEALEVVVRGARIVVEADEGMIIEPMTPVTERIRRNGLHEFALGDLVSRQKVECLLRVNFPRGRIGQEVEIAVRVEADGDAASDEIEIRWTYADNPTNDAQSRDRKIDRKVASTFAALARREALLLNRDGRYEDARTRLQKVARRIRGYAGSDERLHQIADRLEEETHLFSVEMRVMERKARHFEANNLLRFRDARGRARRSEPEGER